MARQARNIRAGLFYHVLNRSAGRIALFRRESDYAAFERIMVEAREQFPLRIVDWCLMKNHWHFVVWPRSADEVTAYFRWLAHTHAMRWRVSRATVGWGHLYQGRFKAFAVEEGAPLRRVRRYVQRQALTAGLVQRAEEWRWGSLWARQQGAERKGNEGAEVGEGLAELRGLLSPESPGLGGDWLDWVNASVTPKEFERLRVSASRGRPYGGEQWVGKMVEEMGLEHTVRREGRPRKEGESK